MAGELLGPGPSHHLSCIVDARRIAVTAAQIAKASHTLSVEASDECTAKKRNTHHLPNVVDAITVAEVIAIQSAKVSHTHPVRAGGESVPKCPPTPRVR